MITTNPSRLLHLSTLPNTTNAHACFWCELGSLRYSWIPLILSNCSSLMGKLRTPTGSFLFRDVFISRCEDTQNISQHQIFYHFYLSITSQRGQSPCVISTLLHEYLTPGDNAPAGIPQLGVYLVKSCLRFVHIVLWVFILLYHIFFLILQR